MSLSGDKRLEEAATTSPALDSVFMSARSTYSPHRDSQKFHRSYFEKPQTTKGLPGVVIQASKFDILVSRCRLCGCPASAANPDGAILDLALSFKHRLHSR